MDDLLQVAIFAAILLLSLLGGAKKKADEQRRVQRRPQPRPPGQGRQPQRPTDSRNRQAAPSGTGRPRQEGLDAILDLLRGELPSAPPSERAPRVPQPAGEIDEEARPLDAQSHRAFHERYVEPELTPSPVRRRRYRLTPKTAREAVVWTAIFSPPKGYE